MEETIRVFDKVLSFAGIRIFAKQHWNSKKWPHFLIFNVFLGFIIFVFTSVFVLSNFSDLLLRIQGVCVWTTVVIMFISLGICLIYRIDFRRFLEEMIFKDRSLDIPLINYILRSNTRHRKLRELKELIINSQEKLFRLTRVLLKTYVVSVWLFGTLYICRPIYLMCISNEKSLSLLAFDMWFPWGLGNFAIYVGSFLFHAYAGYLCCIAYPGLQATIILLIGQIIRNLRILTFVLLNLDKIVEELSKERGDKWQDGCTLVLSQCIDHYIKVKRFSKRFNIICQPFYLGLMLVTTMLMCDCLQKIVKSDKFSPDIMKYCVHMLCFILVLFMFCFLGQQVENECEKLEAAVTEKWNIYNSNHRVNVRIFKMALSQRMPIYIFGSTTLSLSTFNWLIRIGITFFTFEISFAK